MVRCNAIGGSIDMKGRMRRNGGGMLAESLVALATAGSAALVGAMATDAWQATRTGVLGLFGRSSTSSRDGTAAQPVGGTAPEEGGTEAVPAADGRIALVAAQLDGDAALVARADDTAAARRSLLAGLAAEGAGAAARAPGTRGRAERPHRADAAFVARGGAAVGDARRRPRSRTGVRLSGWQRDCPSGAE